MSLKILLSTKENLDDTFTFNFTFKAGSGKNSVYEMFKSYEVDKDNYDELFKTKSHKVALMNEYLKRKEDNENSDEPLFYKNINSIVVAAEFYSFLNYLEDSSLYMTNEEKDCFLFLVFELIFSLESYDIAQALDKVYSFIKLDEKKFDILRDSIILRTGEINALLESYLVEFCDTNLRELLFSDITESNFYSSKEYKNFSYKGILSSLYPRDDIDYTDNEKLESTVYAVSQAIISEIARKAGLTKSAALKTIRRDGNRAITKNGYSTSSNLVTNAEKRILRSYQISPKESERYVLEECILYTLMHAHTKLNMNINCITTI